MNKGSILIMCTLFLLQGCGDNPFNDDSKILDTDYARIRIEIERCNHISDEGSLGAILRCSPRMSCLKHLNTRIVNNGQLQRIPYE